MLYFGRRRWKNHIVIIVVLVVLMVWVVVIWRDAIVSRGSTESIGEERREIRSLNADQVDRLQHQYQAGNMVVERLERIEQLCKAASSPRPHYRASDLQMSQVLISQRSQFLHCGITKAASSFWHRFLQTLNVSGPKMSPFSAPSITERVTQGAPTSSLNSIRHSDERAAFVTSAFRSVFVRNPYSRMLSVYVDHVFSPDPAFWRLWGRRAIKAFRKNADPMSLRCGHDATFAETLAYAAKRLHDSDVHFQPISHLCQPCGFRFHFIGTMETFSQDTVLLAQTLNLSVVKYFQSPQFRSDYTRDAIEDAINKPFSRMSDIVTCMSKYEAGLRIWRTLQIRGLVSRKFRFPFSEAVFQDVTAPQLIQEALDAHRKSVASTDNPKAELQRQRREALVEAYQSVSKGVVDKWASILQEDFALFGYDPHPTEIFEDSVGIVRKGLFDWWRDWG